MVSVLGTSASDLQDVVVEVALAGHPPGKADSANCCFLHRQRSGHSLDCTVTAAGASTTAPTQRRLYVALCEGSSWACSLAVAVGETSSAVRVAAFVRYPADSDAAEAD